MRPDENCPSILVVHAEKQEDKDEGHQEKNDEAWVQELITEFEVAPREYIDVANYHGA